MMLGPVAVGADDPPPFASATEAYRQGVSALNTGRTAVALPALEYAAKRGVLGAQLKLARAYAAGRDVPKDDAKAFSYFQQIADQYADISASSPIGNYVGEAFVALGQYSLDGVPAMSLQPNPAYAADLFRHAASYFGNAEAQYQLARLYLTGDGVEKNPGLAVNWLAMAAKKQHAAAQATLGELLWRGEEVRQRREGTCLDHRCPRERRGRRQGAAMDRRSVSGGSRQVRQRDAQRGRRASAGIGRRQQSDRGCRGQGGAFRADHAPCREGFGACGAYSIGHAGQRWRRIGKTGRRPTSGPDRALGRLWRHGRC
jgi:TPR repeat protein